MKLSARCFVLKLAHRWMIAHGLKSPGGGGTEEYRVVFVELTDGAGRVGWGEGAPAARYRENAGEALAFLQSLDPARLSFDDIPGSMAYVHAHASGQMAAKCAVDIALWDGASRQAGRPLFDHLGLGFTEGKHLTSLTIGLDTPEMIRQKVREASAFPVLKLKMGSPSDEQNLAALREEAPDKWIRVDANEGWETPEMALRWIERLAADGRVQFVEQPLPVDAPLEQFRWLKARSPLPLMADESYHSAEDLPRCAEWADAVNVKLVKTGGLTRAREALEAARRAGLKTMLGCMIESSLLISAAAHLAQLTDYLDLDGNLLITNDPYCGVQCREGVLSFAEAPSREGLCVVPR